VKVAILLLALVLHGAVLAADRLTAQGADVAAVTASGVSSGGYMAIQFQVAHSGRVNGVAALAAGPYYCAQGSLWTALYNCSVPGAWAPLPGVEALKAQAELYARSGQIDPTANLATARVWLFAGTRDHTVERPVVEAAAKFYAAFGAKNIPLQTRPAGHAMVTEYSGTPCGTTEPPFINDCDYDAAGMLLRHLLGMLKPPVATETGRLISFDQNPFAAGDSHLVSLADTGYAYVPTACAAGKCQVHVVFHGCRQNAEAVGERFVREAGYNRWADSNRLIVLYPQTRSRYGPGYSGGRWSYVYNPKGCWDWWGYTGAGYATKAAPQIRAVLSMVERLGAPRN
jgi:poly(3-hydroxybutyrate) depolymerase